MSSVENKSSISSAASQVAKSAEGGPHPFDERKPPKPNPALEMMGIKKIKLPSRNWMIFLAITSSLIGGYFYDVNEQKKIREKYMKLAEPYGAKQLKGDEYPRKLTVFIAPPPNDYLEESLKLFRRYFKPVLNAGGVDFELYHSVKQGVIRNQVAGEIRNTRRKLIDEQQEKDSATKSGSDNGFNSYWRQFKLYFSKLEREKLENEELERQSLKFKDNMKNIKNLVGYYYHEEDKSKLQSHSIDLDEKILNQIGGVVCFGRGVYKEYLIGIHEGLLGPLFKPERVIDALAEDQKRMLDLKREKLLKNKKEGDIIPEPKDLEDIKKEIKENSNQIIKKLTESMDEDEEDERLRPMAIPPYILPEEYPEAKMGIDFDTKVGDLPAYWQQSILVAPVDNLLGFLNIPIRIYKFYNRRQLAEEYGKLALSIVENRPRRFEELDLNLALEEEKTWPKKWVQTGKEKGTDWAKPLITDKKITSHIYVYNDKQKQLETNNGADK